MNSILMVSFQGGEMLQVLLLKVDDLQHLGEFGPISLVGCTYKMLTKVLANRLKVVLPRIIDGRQNTFLENKYLLDSGLVTIKTVDEAK